MENLPKEFDINHWRAVYDRVHELGGHLKKCRDDNIKLKQGEQDHIESEIKTMIENITLYMDKCGVKIPSPLWIYIIKDERTWKSSPKFIYGDRCKPVMKVTRIKG